MTNRQSESVSGKTESVSSSAGAWQTITVDLSPEGRLAALFDEIKAEVIAKHGPEEWDRRVAFALTVKTAPPPTADDPPEWCKVAADDLYLADTEAAGAGLIHAAYLASEEARKVRGLEEALAEAASEINCSGPVAHRIRILRGEHQQRVERLETALREIEREGASGLVLDGRSIASAVYRIQLLARAALASPLVEETR